MSEIRDTSQTINWFPHRLDEEERTAPLRWGQPHRVAVSPDADVFDCDDDELDRIFATMALCPQHTFQVLTKRPELAAEYLNGVLQDDDRDGPCGCDRLGWAAGMLLDGDWIWTQPKGERERIEAFIEAAYAVEHLLDPVDERDYPDATMTWPLPNVWLGTSVEDQATADERIPHLLRCPAALRFVSVEPLLGPVDLWLPFTAEAADREYENAEPVRLSDEDIDDMVDGVMAKLNDPQDRARIETMPDPSATIDWIIVGGESGPQARPCDIEWIRSVVRQGKDAGVPVFVKQLGARASDPENGIAGRSLDVHPDAAGLVSRRLRDPEGGDPAEWPEDLRVRQTPEGGGPVIGAGVMEFERVKREGAA